MANADKGSIEVISDSIGDLIFRIETLTSDRDTIKLCVRAAAEYEAMRAHLQQRALNGDILTAAMDNLTAQKLGMVGYQLSEYPREKIGDEIDRGLVLRRLLEEAGFGVVRLTKSR